jgi:hypothetical protein
MKASSPRCDSELAAFEEDLQAAPLNFTKQLHEHPALAEEKELIPNEHPPFMVQLNTRNASAMFNNKCSSRLNHTHDNGH